MALNMWKKRKSPEEPLESKGSMPLLEHLAELRKRLVISAVAVTVLAIASYGFYGHMLVFLLHPLCVAEPKNQCKLYVTSPLDGFALRVKMAGYAGLFFASPVVLLQFWRFIAPGLKNSERKYSLIFVSSSIGLFTLGGLVAYTAFPHALQFLQGAAGTYVHPIYTPQSYLNLLLALMAAFGAAFEFPVVLISLELLGVVTPKKLAQSRRWAIVIIFAVAAIFIPSSDPFSLFALALPLIFFYEISILIGRLVLRRRASPLAS